MLQAEAGRNGEQSGANITPAGDARLLLVRLAGGTSHGAVN